MSEPNTVYKFLHPKLPALIDGQTYGVLNPHLILTPGIYPLHLKNGTATIVWPPHDITVANAEQMHHWITTREGLAVWQSQNISDPGKTVTTPYRNATGQLTERPNWEMTDKPVRIITDPADVMVNFDEEVKRFRIKIRMGTQGMTLKCTEASSARIRREVAAAGQGAYHTFDYEAQQAIICRPVWQVSLKDWMELQTAELWVMPSRQHPNDAVHGPFIGYKAAMQGAKEIILKATLPIHSTLICKKGNPWYQLVRQVTLKTAI